MRRKKSPRTCRCGCRGGKGRGRARGRRRRGGLPGPRNRILCFVSQAVGVEGSISAEHTPEHTERNNSPLALDPNPREAQYTRHQHTDNPRDHPAEMMRRVARNKPTEERPANTHDEYVQRELLINTQDILREGGDVEVRHNIPEKSAEGGAGEDEEQRVLEGADVVEFARGAGFGESAGAG